MVLSEPVRHSDLNEALARVDASLALTISSLRDTLDSQNEELRRMLLESESRLDQGIYNDLYHCGNRTEARGRKFDSEFLGKKCSRNLGRRANRIDQKLSSVKMTIEEEGRELRQMKSPVENQGREQQKAKSVEKQVKEPMKVKSLIQAQDIGHASEVVSRETRRRTYGARQRNLASEVVNQLTDRAYQAAPESR